MAPFNLSFWHATTKTQANFEVFDFLRIFFLKKVTLSRSNHIQKIQWEIHFFKTPFVQTKLSKSFFWIGFMYVLKKKKKLTSESILDLGSAQTRKTALSLSCVFWLGHLPRSRFFSESSISYKVLGAFRLKKRRFNKYY